MSVLERCRRHTHLATPGGPRFVNESHKTWADSIATDGRGTEQYLHDALTELLRLAVGAGTVQTRAIVGSRQPSVRVLVTAITLDSRTVHGRVEGCDLPISLESVERIACESGIQLITFSPDGCRLLAHSAGRHRSDTETAAHTLEKCRAARPAAAERGSRERMSGGRRGAEMPMERGFTRAVLQPDLLAAGRPARAPGGRFRAPHWWGSRAPPQGNPRVR